MIAIVRCVSVKASKDGTARSNMDGRMRSGSMMTIDLSALWTLDTVVSSVEKIARSATVRRQRTSSRRIRGVRRLDYSES